jgi:hypothetical protein
MIFAMIFGHTRKLQHFNVQSPDLVVSFTSSCAVTGLGYLCVWKGERELEVECVYEHVLVCARVCVYRWTCVCA